MSVAIAFLTLWLLVAVSCSLGGWLKSVSPAVLFVAGFVIPSGGYFAGYFASSRFRRFVLRQNPQLLTLLQASRATGIIFLIANHNGVLPGLFAIPTGSIDVTIGITAPIIAIVLVSGRTPRHWFATWHVCGILGMMVSGTLGIIASPRAMSGFPLGLVPTFLGPVTLILHLMALSISLSGRNRN